MEGFDRSDEGAALMRDCAERAVALAKEAIILEVEKAFPDEDDPVMAARQIGAIITASTMLYSAMLDTVAGMKNQKEAALAVGMAGVMLTDTLIKVDALAKGGR